MISFYEVLEQAKLSYDSNQNGGGRGESERGKRELSRLMEVAYVYLGIVVIRVYNLSNPVDLHS